MAAGRAAAALVGLLSPYVQERVGILVQRMASDYRNGTYEYPRLLGSAAQIAGLLDILSDLDSTIKRGHISAEKELGNGKSPS